MAVPSTGRILIVDDNELICIAFQEWLTEVGYQALAVSCAPEAVRLATQCPFDVVFTDLLMPEMSGVEVCRAIKSVWPQTQVVLISGHPEEIRVQGPAFLQAGGYEEILRKPITLDVLLKVTRQLIGST